jgi:aspartyl-tRNA(Asn)/glutamyl-tRNA(Gln) amidotransferase subunit C
LRGGEEIGYSPVMPEISRREVRHIAKLARLQLMDADSERFGRELTQILGYVNVLNELATEDVPPTAQVTGLSNISRPDVVQPSEAAKEELLACSPLPIVDDHIETLSAHG